MRLTELFSVCKSEGRVPFSFEFFPPKSEKAWDSLFDTITKLQPLQPAYVSVTYGAGGSTRENTHRLVSRLHKAGMTVVAHLTCEGSSRDEIKRILDSYRDEGISNILALKGDVPQNDSSRISDFVWASDLVEFIRNNYPDFGIGVAGFPEGHPASKNRLEEIKNLKYKVDAGADYMVTQLFFDNHDFYDFRERCVMEGIHIPIVAGIMPISTKQGMLRMADLAARSHFPARLLKSIERAQGDEALATVGIHYASEQISDLLYQKVDGIHLYTLNNSGASVQICHNLGLQSLSARV